MKNQIVLNHGDGSEYKVTQTTRSIQPRHDTIIALPGESLAEITRRAYGENSSVKRQKIVNANANLTGVINVPR